MKLSKKQLIYALAGLMAGAIIFIGSSASAQVSGSLWKLSSNELVPIVSSWSLMVPQLASPGNPCVSVTSIGDFATTTCGSGGTSVQDPFPNHATTTPLVFNNASTTFSFLTSGLVGNNQGSLYSFASTSLFGFTPASNAITLTANYPITGGGDLTANRSFSLAFGTTTANSWSALQQFNGNVGLGTSTPGQGEALGVNGGAFLSGTVYANNFYDTSVSGSTCIGETNGLLGTSNCVASLASAGGSLTISSPTGAVDASINLLHSNSFNSLQNFTFASTSQLTATSSVWIDTISGLLAGNNGLVYQAASSTLYGTGTAGQVLMWSGSNPVWAATSTSGTGTVTSIATNHGISGGTITTSGTLGLVSYLATSSLEVAGNIPYWTTSSGFPATLGTIATSTITLAAPFLGSFTHIGSSGSIGWSGLATTSQPSSSNLLVSNGGAGVYGVATSSATCGTGVSCTAFPVLGSTNPSFALAALGSAGVLGAVTATNPTVQATSTLYGVAPAGGYVLGWNNSTSGIGWIATSTSSSSGTVGSGTTGQFPYYAGSGTILTATSSLFLGTNQGIGIGTTTTTGNTLSIQNASASNNIAGFYNSLGSSVAVLLGNGNFGIGTTSPGYAFSVGNTTVGFGISTSTGEIVGYDATNKVTGRISPTRIGYLPWATTTTWTGTTTSAYSVVDTIPAPWAGTLNFMMCYASTTKSFLGIAPYVNGGATTPSYFIASSTEGTITFSAGNTFSKGNLISIAVGTTTTDVSALGGGCDIYATETP